MKVFIDIGHPAHVHYFKNLIKILSEKRHKFIITARDKEIAHYLLEHNDFDYISRGKGSSGIFGKLLYLIKADTQLLRIAWREKPDLFLSFGSPYAAQVSSLVGKPHIALDDTENATFGQLFYRPFSDCILSPSCFENNFGSKHQKFPSYMELSYLHPAVFEPDESVLAALGVERNEPYVIVRFVSWGAVHDIGHHGMSNQNKINAVKMFDKRAKVFISSESKLPVEIADKKIDIPPEKMHDALAFASLFFGESATMSSESAVLGTPAVFLDNVGRGYTNEQERLYGLVFNYTESKEDQSKAIQKGIEILGKQKSKWQNSRKKLLSDKIDLTAFLTWFIVNYPGSMQQLQNDKNIPRRFKTITSINH